MAEPLPKRALDSASNPTEIAQQTFDLERRGFDQRQVQAYLRAISDSLRDAQQRETEMRSRLGKAVRRAEAAEQSVRDSPSSDPAELTRQIGDEVTSVLDAARAAGEQRVSAAEKSAEQLMANAKAEATKIRGAAETILDERRAEADSAAQEIVAEGQAESDELRREAQADAEATRIAAADRVAQVRDDCDGLIREAEEARGQILEDMERRRRQARAQVERLRVGRDRLLRSYDVVRRTLEETTVELKLSLAEAKVKGDTAARLVAAEPLAERVQLEAELADAKLIGTVRVSDSKVLSSPALPRPLQPPQVPNIDLRSEAAPVPRKPRVAKAAKPGPGVTPRPPAVAPTLKPEPVAATSKADIDPADGDRVDANDEPIDEELAGLEDHNLAVVDACDEIEEVVAIAVESSESPPSPSLFAALREQSDVEPETETEADTEIEAAAEIEADTEIEAAAEIEADTEIEAAGEIENRRDALVAQGANQLERRLKRALADEQNDLLAGIRATKKGSVSLSELAGDPDTHLMRYVVAIHEVAEVIYASGSELVDGKPRTGVLPAGAVEELLANDVINPIRDRLVSLDEVDTASAEEHLDPVRAFYRQRKTDHLGDAATRLASLLCTAGACDSLPAGAELPWSGRAAK